MTGPTMKVLAGIALSLPIFLGTAPPVFAAPTPATPTSSSTELTEPEPEASSTSTTISEVVTALVPTQPSSSTTEPSTTEPSVGAVVFDTAAATVGGLIVLVGGFLGVARRDRRKEQNEQERARKLILEESRSRLLRELEEFAKTGERLWVGLQRQEFTTHDEAEVAYAKLRELQTDLKVSTISLPTQHARAIMLATEDYLDLLDAKMRESTSQGTAGRYTRHDEAFRALGHVITDLTIPPDSRLRVSHDFAATEA